MINFKEFGSPYASEQWLAVQHDLAFSYDPVNGITKNYYRVSGGSTNVIVPNLPGCVKIGDYVVYDTTESKYKVLKYNGADISNLDSRYVFGNAVCFKVGSTESKFISARTGGDAAWAPNLSTTPGQYSFSPTPTGVPSTTELYSNVGYNNSYVAVGGNLKKFIAYLGTNGNSSYAAESSADIMSEAGFNACATGTDAAKALYQKYEGSYSAYMAAHMYDLSGKTITGHYNAGMYQDDLKYTRILATGSETGTALSGLFPAAEKAYTFAEGSNAAFAAGKWALPSIDSIGHFMYDGYSTTETGTMTKINNSFSKCTNVELLDNTYYYWSSVRYDSATAWIYGGYNGMLGNGYKSGGFRVRPVIALLY